MVKTEQALSALELVGGRDYVSEDIRQRIAKARKAEGWHPHQLAQYAELADASVVERLEKGDSLAGQEETVLALFGALGVSVSDVLWLQPLTESQRRHWLQQMVTAESGPVAPAGVTDSAGAADTPFDLETALGLFIRFQALRELCAANE